MFFAPSPSIFSPLPIIPDSFSRKVTRFRPVSLEDSDRFLRVFRSENTQKKRSHLSFFGQKSRWQTTAVGLPVSRVPRDCSGVVPTKGLNFSRTLNIYVKIDRNISRMEIQSYFLINDCKQGIRAPAVN